MSYTVDLMGLQLKNPIITASGPWAGNAEGVQRCVDAGAAAVITETISLEARPRISPRFFARQNRLFNVMLNSPLHLEEWEQAMKEVDRKDAKLICSIWGATPSEINYLAKKAEYMGADAIEISISAPIGSRNQLLMKPAPDIRHFIGSAVKAVTIPVMVKLSYEAASSPGFLYELEKSGVRAVSAIDALKGLVGVDIGQRRSKMPAYGGYTGQHIHPVSLAITAALQQYTPLQVVSAGGILDAETAIEFLMLGATALELASAILWKGYTVITEVVEGVDSWLAGQGVQDLAEIRGAALPTLSAFEDIVPRNLLASTRQPCGRTDCLICIQSCLPDAVYLTAEELIDIKADRCDGCGLCVDRCPDGLLVLEWS